MTTITISDNIFKNTDVVLDYLGSPAAFDEPSEAADARWISLAISGEENEAVFRDFYDGKDDLIFTVYAGADVYQPLLETIRASLPKGELITEREARTEEVDRVVGLYFIV